MAASARTLTIADQALNGGWTVVLPRRGRRKHLPRIRSLEQQPWAPSDLETDPIRKSKLLHKMQICMKKTESSPFYHTLMDQIQTPEILGHFYRVLDSESKMQMVIYGIGSISTKGLRRLSHLSQSLRKTANNEDHSSRQLARRPLDIRRKTDETYSLTKSIITT